MIFVASKRTIRLFSPAATRTSDVNSIPSDVFIYKFIITLGFTSFWTCPLHVWWFGFFLLSFRSFLFASFRVGEFFSLFLSRFQVELNCRYAPLFHRIFFGHKMWIKNREIACEAHRNQNVSICVRAWEWDRERNCVYVYICVCLVSPCGSCAAFHTFINNKFMNVK